MTRKLLLTQKQITAICKGASKAGYIPIIETKGLNVRLVPEEQAEDLNHTSNEQLDANVKVRF